jgi:streptomycin 6-kinase
MDVSVEIVDYDPLWPATFSQLRDRIGAVLGPLAIRIEHIGSTAVPGSAAKPIIDLDVVIDSWTDLPAVISSLRPLGYDQRDTKWDTRRDTMRTPRNRTGENTVVAPHGSRRPCRNSGDGFGSPGYRPGMTDAITAKLVRRFGPGAAEWTAGLSASVASLARQWRLDVGEPFDGGALSVVIRVTGADGRPAVLKLSPDAASLAEQAGMLHLFEPSGRVPAVLADAPGALLLEAVQPGTAMDDVPQQPTPAQFAELLADLHAVDPPPGVALRDVRVLADEFVRGGMGQLTEPTVAARLHRSDFERALEELDTLSATPSPTVLLHGDLHLGNVLDGGPRGLVAIDPMACVGDRCWDAVDYVLDGADRRDGIEYRLHALSTEARLDAERLYAWCRVVAAATAIQALRHGGQERVVDELLALAR